MDFNRTKEEGAIFHDFCFIILSVTRPCLLVALFYIRRDQIAGTCFLPHLDDCLVNSIQATEN